MANRQVPASLKGIVRFRTQRVFRVWFYCDAPDCSELGSEWCDEMLTVSHSWCPSCGRRAEPEPNSWEEFEEERAEFDIDTDDEETE